MPAKPYRLHEWHFAKDVGNAMQTPKLDNPTVIVAPSKQIQWLPDQMLCCLSPTSNSIGQVILLAQTSVCHNIVISQITGSWP